jgi:mono/diheme cytochrome c family protein
MRWALLFALLALGACDDMVRQPRYDDYGPGKLFADGKAMQVPPDGTVARDMLQIKAVDTRPPLTFALLERGRERYGIYCAVCHAADGSGRGTVPARGYPQPRAFQDADQRTLAPQHIHDVITNGYGVMYPHADRVAPADRWAITAYVLALRRVGPRE